MSRKVMIVDDEPLVRGLVAEIIRDNGYETYEFENGKDAYNAFMESVEKGEQYPIIFSDMVMPIMDGDVFLKNIKLLYEAGKIQKLPYFVGMSGYDQTVKEYETRLSAYSNSALSFMKKPFALDAITRELTKAEAYLTAA